MGCTLVIDTSFGSTVGIVGREPIVETDSRTHVEKLQVNIARAVEEAGLTPADIEEIVVGIGPAPFTGLRAGIVAAKALAFATGAKLVGQNVLDPQGEMMNFVLGDSAMFDGIDFLADVPRLSSRQSDGDVPDAEAKEHELDRHVTLCVNDARRKQLYFSLNHGSISLPGEDAELMTIGVGKAYQRQGIAAALLQVLVDEAKRQGASRMLLEVRVDNDPALALYQRFGFERMGLRKRYYQPEGIDAYTMSLDLKPRVVGFAAPQTASADIEDITSKQTEKNGEAR